MFSITRNLNALKVYREQNAIKKRSPYINIIKRNTCQKNLIKSNPIKLSQANIREKRNEINTIVKDKLFYKNEKLKKNEVWEWQEFFSPLNNMKLSTQIDPSHLKYVSFNQVQVPTVPLPKLEKISTLSPLEIESLIFNEEGTLLPFTYHQLNELLGNLLAKRQFNLAVKVYELSSHNEFKQNIHNQMLYVKSQLQSSYFHPIKIAPLVKNLLRAKNLSTQDKSSLLFLKGLIQSHNAEVAKEMWRQLKSKNLTQEATEKYARCFKENISTLQSTRSHYQEELNKSIVNLEGAFYWMPTPENGERLIYQYFERSDYSKGMELASKVAHQKFATSDETFDKLKGKLIAAIIAELPINKIEGILIKIPQSNEGDIKQLTETLKVLKEHLPNNRRLDDVLNYLGTANFSSKLGSISL